MSRQTTHSRSVEAGFTMIELMIASLVFTVILIVVTIGILSFTHQYYKGVISSNTQATARAIIDDATRAIQFNSGGVIPLDTTPTEPGPAPPLYGYCVGTTKRYSFALSQQVTDGTPNGTHQGFHGLISDDLTNGCGVGTTALDVDTMQQDLSDPALKLTNPRELLGEHMRLANFEITSEPSDSGQLLYTVTVRVVYGDDDLLCSPTGGAGECSDPAQAPDSSLERPDITCKSVPSGTQFCSVAQLSTTITKRVN